MKYANQLVVLSHKWESDTISDKFFIKAVGNVYHDAQMLDQVHAIKWLSQNLRETETITDLACVMSAMICAETIDTDILELYADELLPF